MSLSLTCSCLGGWECLSASDRSDPHFSRKNMSVPAISLMRPTSHRVERNQKKRAEAMCVAGRYSGCLYLSLLFSFFFKFLCMHLCWCMPHECIPTETRRVHWIISASHGFKSQLSVDMGAWAREWLCHPMGLRH